MVGLHFGSLGKCSVCQRINQSTKQVRFLQYKATRIEAGRTTLDKVNKEPNDCSLQQPKVIDLKAEVMLRKLFNVQTSQSTLYNITKSTKNKDKSLSTYYKELKSLQQELLGACLDKPNEKTDAAACNATLSMMASFTPMFTQFLAWQRLMQIGNPAINFAPPPVTPAAVPVEHVTNLAQKRHFKQQEVSEDVEPPTKRKKLTLADCIDNLLNKKAKEVKVEKSVTESTEVQKDSSLEKPKASGGEPNGFGEFELQFSEDNDLLRQEEVTPQQQYLQITENEPLESDPDVEVSPLSPSPNNFTRDEAPQLYLPPLS